MFKSFRNSIVTKAISVIGISLLLVSLLLIEEFRLSQIKMYNDTLSVNMTNYIDNKKALLNNLVNSRLQGLQVLASDEFIVNYLYDINSKTYSKQKEEDIQSKLNNYIDKYSYIDRVEIIIDNNIYIDTNNINIKNRSVKDEYWYKYYLGSNSNIISNKLRYDKNILIDVVIPITKNGKDVAQMHASIRLVDLIRDINDSYNSNGIMLVIDSDGKVVNYNNILTGNISDSTILESGDFKEYTIGEVDKFIVWDNLDELNLKAMLIVDKEQAYSVLNDSIFNLRVISILTALGILILMSCVAIKWVRPLRLTIQFLDAIAKGDVGREFNLEVKNSESDIGKCIVASKNVQKTILRILNYMVSSSDALSKNANSVQGNIINIQDNIQNIQEVTESMSASLEETSASTLEIENVIGSIKDSSNVVKGKIDFGVDKVQEIKNSASENKIMSAESMEKASNRISKIDVELNSALKKSEVVKDIDILTSAIMDIADQTNLLAINASIEATRAGKYGSGFIVIASEIRNLAELSKESVVSIKQTVKEVTSSIETLRENSLSLLEFMNTTVISDYKKLAESSDSYYNDADLIEGITKSFRDAMKSLDEQIESLRVSISDISKANSINAEGSTEIVSKIDDTLNSVNVIVKDIQEVTDSTIEMHGTVTGARRSEF